MILYHLFIANVISMSNLTLFLDRLITHGKYNSIHLVYDDASIKDTDFVPQLVDLSQGKYAMFITKKEYSFFFTKPVMTPYRSRSDLLQVLMLNYDEGGKTRLVDILKGQNLFYSTQNVVLLMPMQSNERKREVWNCFNERTITRNTQFTNISVVFYQTETSMKVANASRKSIEIFVLNYKASQNVEPKEIDVENSSCAWNNQVNECNLHDKIFGEISKKISLSIHLKSTTIKSVTKEPILYGNNALVNFGVARNYLRNFFVRNLRLEDVEFQNICLYIYIDKFGDKYYQYTKHFLCDTSNEKIYGELYNENITLIPSNYVYRINTRFVILIFNRINIFQLRRYWDPAKTKENFLFSISQIEFIDHVVERSTNF